MLVAAGTYIMARG